MVNVSWRDAMTYCEWLNQVTGRRITLPSEAQWEKAGRGGKDQRIYPWGDAFGTGKCNSSEFGFGNATPVGLFAEGASPYSVLDMSGNVWEWTSALFKEYPYDANDGREDPGAGGTRVLCGGSFDFGRRFARCAFRYKFIDLRYSDLGFRVVSPGL